MIQQFFEAIATKDVPTLHKMFDSPVFFRDKDKTIYTDPEIITEKLLTYHTYHFDQIVPYESLNIVRLSKQLFMKVKTKNNAISKIYLREVPEGQKRLRIDFSYDGSHYYGLQRQPTKQPTIQKEIEKVLKHILQHDLTAIFAGRTDKGVHALHQVAHCDSTSPIPTKTILQLMNKMLPNDIHIHTVSEVPPVFHARYDCLRKTYLYILSHEKKPFDAHYTHIVDAVNIDRLKALLNQLKGTHDFIGFSKLSPGKPTIRTIDAIDVKSFNQQTHIELTSKGFLRHMVRIIVGNALKDLFQETSTIKDALSNPSKNNIKYMAPPQGLYLKKLQY